MSTPLCLQPLRVPHDILWTRHSSPPLPAICRAAWVVSRSPCAGTRGLRRAPGRPQRLLFSGDGTTTFPSHAHLSNSERRLLERWFEAGTVRRLALLCPVLRPLRARARQGVRQGRWRGSGRGVCARRARSPCPCGCWNRSVARLHARGLKLFRVLLDRLHLSHESRQLRCDWRAFCCHAMPPSVKGPAAAPHLPLPSLPLPSRPIPSQDTARRYFSPLHKQHTLAQHYPLRLSSESSESQFGTGLIPIVD